MNYEDFIASAPSIFERDWTYNWISSKLVGDYFGISQEEAEYFLKRLEAKHVVCQGKKVVPGYWIKLKKQVPFCETGCDSGVLEYDHYGNTHIMCSKCPRPSEHFCVEDPELEFLKSLQIEKHAVGVDSIAFRCKFAAKPKQENNKK